MGAVSTAASPSSSRLSASRSRAIGRFLWRRLLLAIPVLFAVIVIGFCLTRLVPGDPITALVGDYPAPAAYVAQVREAYGLDQPLATQFTRYMANVLAGDLGFSFANQQPVATLLMHRIGNTLLLMIPTLLLASLIGIVLGALAATQRSRLADAALSSLSMIGYSVPVFWLGQILIIAFAVHLRWLPAQGMLNVRGSAHGVVLDYLQHWVLPGFAATLFYCAVVARVSRSSIREILGQDFVTTARAKGQSDRAVLFRHVLPNALMPIASVIGYNFGNAITGTILIESVFAWPGLGTLFLSSIGNRDYPVLQGIFLITAAIVVLANLLTDLSYALIDPRVRDVQYQ